MEEKLTPFEAELKDIIETYICDCGKYYIIPEKDFPVLKEYAKDLLKLV